MQRYNLFDQLHKGLQSLLSDTARMLQKTDFASTFEAEEAIGRLGRFIRVLNDQALLEEACLFTCVQKLSPSIVFVLQQDHQHIRVAEQRLKSIIKVYRQSVSPEEKNYAGKMLATVFTELMILVLRHFTREENLINTILWSHFSDAEIAGTEQDIISCISPEDLMLYNLYTCRNLNAGELYNRLHRLKTTGLQAFHELSAGAEHELATTGLQELYTEEMLVA